MPYDPNTGEKLPDEPADERSPGTRLHDVLHAIIDRLHWQSEAEKMQAHADVSAALPQETTSDVDKPPAVDAPEKVGADA